MTSSAELRRPCVAIAGAGFSGSATAFHLLRAARGPLDVVLIDAEARMGRGLAYSTRCDSHLLNVPAGRLGLDPDDESHFLHWLQRQGLPFRSHDFVPRHWLGRYVLDALQQAAGAVEARGVRLRLVDGRVAGLTPHAGRQRVHLADGSTLAADQVVLATGHGPSAPPAFEGDVAWHDPGMVADPWSGAIRRLGPLSGDVLLIGSGLTAIDVVAQLADDGFAGRVHLLSRRGLLPQAHRPNETRPALGQAPLADEPTLRGLVAALRASARQAPDWRDVVASLRPVTPALWRRLDEADRRRFLRHVQPFWDVHRHRLAPAVHAQLRAALDADRARVHAGRLAHVERRADGGFQATWRPRATPATASVVVQAIVNCTGPTMASANPDDPLLASLLQAGQVTTDGLGLGLAFDDTLHPRDASPALHYVGPMLKAARWEAIAVPELRVHARDVAHRVLDALAGR